jgi:uncharacterized repeat protein (TIGR01451 family)
MAGHLINYHIEVKNNGPSGATGVVVTDRLPSSSTFVSATPSTGACLPPAGGVLTCNIGSMNNGATATVDVVVRAHGPNTIYDTASVTANEADPNPANNEVTESTTVVGFRTFSFSQAVVTGGCGSPVGTLLFTGPMPAGVKIDFIENSSGVDSIPSVTTVGGETSIQVTVSTNLVNAEQIVPITAKDGAFSVVGRVKVVPVRITNLALTPNPVKGGKTVTGTVTLSCAVPGPQGIIVQLTSSRPGSATLNVSQITIPVGQTSKQFTLTTKGSGSPINSTITAKGTAIGTISKVLTINP